MTILLVLAVAAFCVWLAVRIVNRRETWAKWTLAGVVGIGGIAFMVWWDWAFGQAMHGVFVGDTGPVSSRADWPQPLKDLLEHSGAIEIDVSTIRVHCLCRGYDPEFVWRMDALPGLFELLDKRWKLETVTGSDWGVLEGYRNHNSHVPTPDWWSPRDDGQTSFYMFPLSIADTRGNQFRVAVDEKRETIWVHFYNKF